MPSALALADIDAAAAPLYAAPWVAGPARVPVAGAGLEIEPVPTAGSRLSVTRIERVGVVFDGDLYNREELGSQLALPRATGAAEVVARAYERWGADLVHRMRGIFALVIHDEQCGRTLGVRDALGAMPLFYTESSGRVLLSVSIDALRNQPGVSRAFNRAALADHLCHRWPDQEETFFAAIRRVPPGYMLRSEGGVVRVSRYWEPAPLDRPVDWIAEEEVQPRFDAAFERAVYRTLDHGPTGIYLSGGLDSISVAAMAADGARRRGRPLPIGLSLGFPGDSDEEKEQRGVAAALGLEHHFVPFDEAAPASRLLAAALEITRRQASPLLNTWMPAYTSLVLRGKTRGVRIITSGAGGDEWLAVSPYLAADMMRARDVRGLGRLLRGWSRSYRMPPLSVARCLLWRFGLRPLASAMVGGLAPAAWRANRLARGVRGTKPWVGADPQLRQELDARVAQSLAPTNPPGGFYLHDVRHSLEHPLTVLELEEMFEMGRRLDVRFLHPYWDAEVVDILYRTPPLHLFADGRSKSVVRQTMARRFPGLGLEHQKKRSGTSFYGSVLDREIPELWERNEQVTEIADLGIVEPAAAADMARRSIESKIGTGLVNIWDLMNVNTWVRAHQ